MLKGIYASIKKELKRQNKSMGRTSNQSNRVVKNVARSAKRGFKYTVGSIGKKK